MTEVSPILKPSRRSSRARLRRRVQARRQLRSFVEDRCNGLCEANTPACPFGSHRGEQAHHILMRSQGGPDDLGNLLFVCASAHEFIHSHPAESYAHGWLRRSTVTLPRRAS